jgi:hypothetical protein
MKSNLWKAFVIGMMIVCTALFIACLIAGFSGKAHCFITAIIFAMGALVNADELADIIKENK